MSAKTNKNEKSQSPQQSQVSGEISDELIYLDKDTKQKYPVRKHDLDNVIVFQFTKEKIRELEFDVPATHINAIGMYSPDEFEQHKQEGGLFDRMKLLYEVWHDPREVDTEQQ